MDELARNIHIPVVGAGDVVAYRTITSATISNIENDKNNPSADIIIALSEYFNVSTDWILKGKEFVKIEYPQAVNHLKIMPRTLEEDNEFYNRPPKRPITKEEYDEFMKSLNEMDILKKEFDKKFVKLLEIEIDLNNVDDEDKSE